MKFEKGDTVYYTAVWGEKTIGVVSHYENEIEVYCDFNGKGRLTWMYESELKFLTKIIIGMEKSNNSPEKPIIYHLIQIIFFILKIKKIYLKNGWFVLFLIMIMVNIIKA